MISGAKPERYGIRKKFIPDPDPGGKKAPDPKHTVLLREQFFKVLKNTIEKAATFRSSVKTRGKSDPQHINSRIL
jgi:hypothetical protein